MSKDGAALTVDREFSEMAAKHQVAVSVLLPNMTFRIPASSAEH
jgi:hypothetical protein